MADTTPSFATRKAVADEDAQRTIKKISKKGWPLTPTYLEALSIEAERYLIVQLIGAGRLTQEEVEAVMGEYKALRLEADYHERCQSAKGTTLAIARKLPPEQIAPVILAKGAH